jgi:hypothetical protein
MVPRGYLHSERRPVSMSLEVRTSEGDVIRVELPDSWVNFGDVNPQAHGGLFARFGDSGLTVLDTWPPGTIPETEGQDVHFVSDIYGHYDDFWVTVDDQDHPSDLLAREIDAVSHVDSLQQAAADGHLPHLMAHSLTRLHGNRHFTVPDSEYQSTLQEDYDIPDEVF